MSFQRIEIVDANGAHIENVVLELAAGESKSVIVNYSDEIKSEVMNNYMYSIIDKYDVIIGEYK